MSRNNGPQSRGSNQWWTQLLAEWEAELEVNAFAPFPEHQLRKGYKRSMRGKRNASIPFWLQVVNYDGRFPGNKQPSHRYERRVVKRKAINTELDEFTDLTSHDPFVFENEVVLEGISINGHVVYVIK